MQAIHHHLGDCSWVTLPGYSADLASCTHLLLPGLIPLYGAGLIHTVVVLADLKELISVVAHLYHQVVVF